MPASFPREQAMADAESAPQPPLRSWVSERQHESTTKGWGRSLFRTESTPTRIPDPELGPFRVRNKAAEIPQEYPRLAAFTEFDEKIMMYRRFGRLYTLLILDCEDSLKRSERELNDPDVQGYKICGGLSRPNLFDQSEDHSVRNMPMQKLCEPLSAYSKYKRDNEKTC